jgi:hypothetical protein
MRTWMRRQALFAGVAVIAAVAVACGGSSEVLGGSSEGAAARAVFDATTRFHNPAHAAQWTDPEIDAASECLGTRGPWTRRWHGRSTGPTRLACKAW